eukprot:TRINITY_DN7159_c0_g1_i1.p1 TRINITY_DN7159_c0_g1~~TRINITY_DN7159_c0_g1_i1.p1  ORF type:complete len:2707 (+),score=519.17 TRINITY_DN7159_c0_g1_i1:787-8121(+)
MDSGATSPRVTPLKTKRGTVEVSTPKTRKMFSTSHRQALVDSASTSSSSAASPQNSGPMIKETYHPCKIEIHKSEGTIIIKYSKEHLHSDDSVIVTEDVVETWDLFCDTSPTPSPRREKSEDKIEGSTVKDVYQSIENNEGEGEVEGDTGGNESASSNLSKSLSSSGSTDGIPSKLNRRSQWISSPSSQLPTEFSHTAMAPLPCVSNRPGQPFFGSSRVIGKRELGAFSPPSNERSSRVALLSSSSASSSSLTSPAPSPSLTSPSSSSPTSPVMSPETPRVSRVIGLNRSETSPPNSNPTERSSRAIPGNGGPDIMRRPSRVIAGQRSAPSNSSSESLKKGPPVTIEHLCGLAWNGTDPATWNEALANFPKSQINDYNARGSTALYCAARQGHLHIVASLLGVEGIDINKGEKGKNSTPLHVAGWEQRQLIVALLLLCGADPSKKNLYGLTPIEEIRGEATYTFVNFTKEGPEALYTLHPQLLSIMASLNPADFPVRVSIIPGTDKLEGTPVDLWNDVVSRLESRGIREVNTVKNIHYIHRELYGGPRRSEQMISELCSAANSTLSTSLMATHSKWVNYANAAGYTPLYLACVNGRKKCVIEFLKYPEIDINVQVFTESDDGYTPLHGAIKSGNHQIVALLLYAGAEPDKIKNSVGHSAKQYLFRLIFQNESEKHIAEGLEKMVEIFKTMDRQGSLSAESFLALKEIESLRHLPGLDKNPARDAKIKLREIASMLSDESKLVSLTFDLSLLRFMKVSENTSSLVIFWTNFKRTSLRFRTKSTLRATHFGADSLFTLSSSSLTKSQGIPLSLSRGPESLDRHWMKTSGETLDEEADDGDEYVRPRRKVIEIPKFPKSQTLLTLTKQKMFRRYSPKSEIERQGISDDWKVLDIENGTKTIIVPTWVNQERVSELMDSFILGNFPTYCWGTVLPRKGVLLRAERLRSLSKKETEVKRNSPLVIEYLEELYYLSNKGNQHLTPLLVIDMGASVQTNLGYLQPKYADFDNCNLREAFNELLEISTGNSQKFVDFLPSFMNLEWTKAMGHVCKIVNEIVERIEEGQWIVIQGAEDSKYMDSLVACLVQLMLDPHYRTTVGFLKLLCKDWFGEGTVSLSPHEAPQDSFRHSKSAANLSILSALKESKNDLLFHKHCTFLLLQCTWYLVLHFEESFEFSRNFVEFMSDTLLTCRNLRPVEEADKLPRYRDAIDSFTEECLQNFSGNSSFENPFFDPSTTTAIPHTCDWSQGDLTFLTNYHSTHQQVVEQFKKFVGETKPTKLVIPPKTFPFLPLGLTPELSRFTSLSIASAVLPPDFHLLTQLVELSLSSIVAPLGNIPQVVCYMLNLEKLELLNSDLSYLPKKMSNLTKLKTIVLSNNNFTRVSAELFELKSLTSLSIVENSKFSELPLGISNLGHLSELELRANYISIIPFRWMRALPKNITKMDLSSNFISELPNEWGELCNLVSLKLSSNKLSDLPPTMANCTALKTLHLNNNNFESLPFVISKMSGLEDLSLPNNQLQELPYWISKLKAVKKFNLRSNKLTVVTHAMSQMSELSVLDLSQNNITELPTTLCLLEDTLKVVGIIGNPIPDFKDILGNQEILRMLKEKLNAECFLAQTTILILGGPQSGKSSVISSITESPHWTLIRSSSSMRSVYLKKGLRRSDTDEKDKSHPVEIKTFKVEFEDKKDKKKKDKKEKRDKKEGEEERVRQATVQFVDFNSDIVLKGCFHFFLRRSGLILLTYDLVNYQSPALFKHWLFCIKAYIVRPRVMVVLTSVDEYINQYNYSLENKVQQIKEEAKSFSSCFNNIIVIWRKVDSKKAKDGIIKQKVAGEEEENNLSQAIKKELLKTESVRKKVPFTYTQLATLLDKVGRDAIEKGHTPMVTLNKILNYANMCGLQGLSKIREAISAFHASGFLLAFPFHANSYLLQPSWFALFLSELFLHSKVARSPLLDSNQLESLLKRYPTGMRNAIIPLLETCELAVPLSFPTGSVEYIDAFLSDKPKTTPRRGHSHELLRIIKIDFLPQGMMNKLIQQTLTTFQHEIKAMDVWKQGLWIRLKDQDLLVSIHLNDPARVVKTEGPKKDELVISVSSPTKIQTRTIFTKITDIFGLMCREWVSVEQSSFALLPDGQLICVNDFDENIKSANFVYNANGTSIDLFDVIPDLLIWNFPGPRISIDDIPLGRVLGEGGFAKVYESTLNGKKVAVKMLLETEEQHQGGDNRKAMEEFRQEIDVQGSLNHPSIVSVLGIVLRPFCLITELCPMGDLFTLLNSTNIPISWVFRLKIAQDIAEGLKYLQEQTPPIAHIDLKSPNVLMMNVDVTSKACALIADFGTSQLVTQPITVSKVDNPVWQAPEMLNCEPYTETVDTYSYGIILWELLTRERPYANFCFISDVASSVIAGERPLVSDACPKVYKKLMTSCWAQKPIDRPKMTKCLHWISKMQARIPK